MAQGGETRPITVLVADDSASIRTLVRITLTSQGWTVLEAETAERAMAMARERLPDLAILDITFGETGPDGLAVCAELKADAKTAGIPVVVLTAHDDPAERRRAEAAGANAFVGKPFGPLELMNVVRELIAAAPGAPALGIFLLDAGAVEPTVLERALIEQRELVQQGKPKRLGDVLLERGIVSSNALDRALLEQMHARSLKTEQARVQVLIIDDHAAVREGLKALIRGEEGLDVVGEAAEPSEGLRLARRHQPGVIILDNEMHTGSGLDLIPTLRAEVPAARIVMFSLDSSVRDRALAAGAHVFVSKDAPMAEILSTLQRSAAPTAPSEEVTVPPIHTPRDLRRAALVIATALVLWVPLFLVLEPSSGASAGVFSAVPVVVIGALLGPEGGLVGAVLVLALTFTLESFTGHAFGEPMLAVGDGPGAVMVLLLGFAAGALRIMGLHVDPRRRRADAIAEATRAVAGLDRGEFVAALLEAMLRVAPGEVAALFTNAAGDARFVSATRSLSNARIDSLAPIVREVMRAATARTSTLTAPTEAGDGLRYVALVPVSVPGQEVRGVLAVLGRRRPFGAADITVLRPFAHQLWMIMRSGPITRAAQVEARTKEHAG